MTFSELCNSLGCPLTNARWSWCALAHNQTRVIFTIWADGLLDGRYLLWPAEHQGYMDRNGGKEMQRTLNLLFEKLEKKEPIEILGVRCEAKNPDAEPRSRKYLDHNNLLSLRLEREDEGIIAYVKGQMTTIDIINQQPVLAEVPYAIDDLNIPNGNEAPDRITGQTYGYIRDATVRNFVINRSGGRCEYCQEPGFITSANRNYVEAHHIISLAAQGPDTIANVIALCPNHHREAHYGANAEELEKNFFEILSRLNSPH